MLQLFMDYVEIITKGGLTADISALFQKHKELLETDVGMDQMFAAYGMAGNSTILRFVQAMFCIVKSRGAETGIFWDNYVNTMIADSIVPCIFKSSISIAGIWQHYLIIVLNLCNLKVWKLWWSHIEYTSLC